MNKPLEYLLEGMNAVMQRAKSNGAVASRNQRKAFSGFSLIELVLVVAIILIFLAFAIPTMQTMLAEYRHRAAVASMTTAIQGTRYQALRAGFPYAIQFDPATASYQVSNRPIGAAVFANVGGAIPLEGGQGMVVNQTTRLEFSPNGTVQATVGAMTLTVTNGALVRTITISRVGRVQVTP